MAFATAFQIDILKLFQENFGIRYFVEALPVITVNFSHYWLVNGQEKVTRKGLVIVRHLISNKSSHLMYVVLEPNTFLEDLLHLLVRKLSHLVAENNQVIYIPVTTIK